MNTTSISKATLVQQFIDPPQEYGLTACWWWEGQTVTKERLTWQLEEMKKSGTSATYFYLRYCGEDPFALVPAYGSDEFLDLFRYSIEEHRRLGMEAYFSEWTGQRSVVDQIASDPKDYEQLAGKRLGLHEQQSETSGSLQIEIPSGEEVLSAAAYKMSSNGLDEGSRQELKHSIRDRVLTWEAPEAGWLLTIVTSQTHSVDWLNHSVADRWVEQLWRPYLQKMPEFIGNTFKGYVQDELDVLGDFTIYSPVLLERFATDKGYDPLSSLIALFHDIGPRTDKIRCDYYGVMSQLLEENVYMRLLRWHENRNMLYGTVAIRGRQDVLAETKHFGDLFGLMRSYHFPGNEDPQVDARLPRQRRFIDAKLSSSAAHIYGRKRAAVCAYWGAGWGMTVEQGVDWTNENYAYGMNLYNAHLAAYSMVGGWYEWVPPAHFFYQPYWKHYGVYTDYVRRLSCIMSQGVHAADVAILFPTTTIHANWLGGNRFTLAADTAACATYNMADSLYSGGVDFDFIDDQTICKAEIRDGALSVAGMAFRVVALPPMTTIRIDTLRKLKELYDSGGIVLAFRDLPSASAECGRDDPEVRSILQGLFGISSSEEYDHSTTPEGFSPADTKEDIFSSSIRIRKNSQEGIAVFVPGEQNVGTNASAIDLPAILNSVMKLDICEPGSPDWRHEMGTTIPAQNVYYTHQRIHDADIYFLHNPSSEKRNLTLDLRVEGNPEIWDAATGTVEDYHRFERREGFTRVRLQMEPKQAVILSFTQSDDRPEVTEDNVDAITEVVPSADAFELKATCRDGGRKTARIRHKHVEYRAETRIEPPPNPIHLDGEWDFRLKPTMDNRWGDYRYPPSPTMLGPEARRFKYAEESKMPGTQLGWHTEKFDDGNWPEHVFSYGPYWRSIGPLPEGEEPEELLSNALSGTTTFDEIYEIASHTLRWERYHYSQLFGNESKHIHQVFGGLNGISDYFIVFDELTERHNASRYLTTTIQAQSEGDWDLLVGGKGNFPRTVWVNGTQVLSTGRIEEKPESHGVPLLPRFQQAPWEDADDRTEDRVRVHLNEGSNTVVLRLVQPHGDSVWAYAAFVSPGASPSSGKPPIPRLKWFVQPPGLIYDIRPDTERKVGWYRFEAPAGTRSMTIAADAVDVTAWFNGEPVEVREGRIELAESIKKISQVALRIVQKPGCYAGAALPEPVAFECEPTIMPLGDWYNYALETYSGGAVYAKSFELDNQHLDGRVMIDLGKVCTSAKVRVNGVSVGVTLAPPYRFDITEYVQEGINKLEIDVYNTLANHCSTLPSRYVYEGQTVSGLLGPVSVEFMTETTMIARPT